MTGTVGEDLKWSPRRDRIILDPARRIPGVIADFAKKAPNR